MRLITGMIRRIARTPNRCKVDNFHTFPVNQRDFLPKMIEKDCWAAPKLCRLMFGTRSVHRETFLQVHLYILRHRIQEYPHYGTIQMKVEFLGGPALGNLYLEMVMEEKAQYQLRDFREVRPPEFIRPFVG